MTTYIKVMSEQNLPDADPQKNFTLYTLADGDSFRFVKESVHRAGASSMEDVLQIQRRDEQIFGPSIGFLGNIYVMDATGKTICTKTQKFGYQS